MSTSQTAKLRKRADRMEELAIGMGFLLLKLRGEYGADFNVGMTEQVNQAIADYRQITRERMERKQREAAPPA